MSETILLVEDSADDRLFMSRAFAKAGMASALQMVSDGRNAIAYLSGEGSYADRAIYPLPRLVLLDLKMRQISGFDVLKWIREQPAFLGLIVVMLTSSDHSSDIRKSYALGANSFLSKPGAPEELTELVRDVVNYWMKKNVTEDSGTPDPKPESGPSV